MTRQRSAIEWQDIVAATFVVGTDLIECDYLNVQPALDNLPTEGGSVFVLPGTYDELVTFPLKPVKLVGSGDATVIAPTIAGEIFAFPNGLAELTNVVIEDIKVSGDQTLAQTAFAYKDVNSYWRLITNRVHITGVRKIDDIQAREGTFTRVFQTDHFSARFMPTTVGGGVNVLCDTVEAAGSYAGATGIVYHDSTLCDESFSAADGWHYDFDGDTIFVGTCYIELESNSTVDGHESQGSLLSCAGAALTLEVLGANYASFDCIQNQYLVGSFTLKLSGTFFGNVAHLLIVTAANVILNADGWQVDVCQSGATNAGVVVDVLSGADGCRVSGFFKDAATASIRTAALRTIIAPSSFTQVNGKTVLETGSADFTVIDDCVGLNTGTGMTIIGASTKVNGAQRSTKSASSTNALVTVVPTITNPNGLLGFGTVKNTDGANSLDVKETFTDGFGTSSTLTTTVIAGATLPIGLQQNIGTGFPPYVSYKAEIIDTVAGNHATYLVQFTAQGVT